MLAPPVSTRHRSLLAQFQRLSRSRQAQLLRQLHDAHFHPHYQPAPPAYLNSPHAAARR